MTERRVATVSVNRYHDLDKEVQVIARYLPENYHVVHVDTGNREVWIEGTDVAGWTLDGYVLPRLASGMHFGREVEQA